MKRFQQLFAATVITLLLTISTFAGEMGFPVASATPATGDGEMGFPVASATPTGDGEMGFPGATSTVSLETEAMLNVLQSILAAF